MMAGLMKKRSTRKRLLAGIWLLLLLVAACRSPPQAAGPFGLLVLPTEYESRRVSFRDVIADNAETLVAEMEGEGSLRHLWLTVDAVRRSPADLLSIRLKIYADGAQTAVVDVPVGPFFGMHHGHAPVDATSPYLTVTRRGGFNAYFPMPFQRGLRITLANETKVLHGVWLQADYQRYKRGTLTERRRFHAAYRHVERAERFGRPYHLGHSTGRGMIVGVSLGMRVFDRFDDWYHGGGDLLLLDGHTAAAHVISGIGGEDFFGTAWGQEAFAGGPLGSPYYEEYPDAPPDRPSVVFAAQRFFNRDPLAFRDSFWYDFGSLANEMASVLYWYEDGAGASDAPSLKWTLCGPFSSATPADFERSEFPEQGLDLQRSAPVDFGQYARAAREDGVALVGTSLTSTRWVTDVAAHHNFVDVTPHFRPRLRTNGGLPRAVSAYAATSIEAGRAGSRRIRIGHDDRLRLWINKRLVYDGPQQSGFRTQEIAAELRAGSNDVLLKVANHDNTNFRAWVFLFDVLE